MATSNTTPSEDHNGDDSVIDDLDDLPEIRCDVCNLPFNTVRSYTLHINGKKHNSKVRANQMKKKININQSSEEAAENGDEDIPDAIYCALCKLHCSGYVPYKQHLKSSKHLKQMNKDKLNEHLQNTPEVLAEKKKKTPGKSDSEGLIGLPKSYGRCDICSKVFYAPENLKQHMESPAHLKKVTQANMKTRLQSSIVNQEDADVIINDESTPDTDENITKVYAECRTCSKKFSGPESFQMHLVSGSHKNRIEMQKLEEKMKDKGEGPGVVTDGNYLCKECDKTFVNFKALKQHLENNIHAKMNTKKDIADFLNKYPEITKLPPTTEDGVAATEDESFAQEMEDFYVCRFCKSSFSGPECAKQHVIGKRHRRVKEIMKRLDAADNASSELRVSSTSDAAVKVSSAPKASPSSNAVVDVSSAPRASPSSNAVVDVSSAQRSSSDSAAADVPSSAGVSPTSNADDQGSDNDNTDGFEIIH